MRSIASSGNDFERGGFSLFAISASRTRARIAPSSPPGAPFSAKNLRRLSVSRRLERLLLPLAGAQSLNGCPLVEGFFPQKRTNSPKGWRKPLR